MPAFKFDSTKANFHISGEKLTIVANKTGLENQDGNQDIAKSFSYTEVAIVVKILQTAGYKFEESEMDGKKHYSFKYKNEIGCEILQFFSAVYVDQDLITIDEELQFSKEFKEYIKDVANLNNYHCSFFADRADEHQQMASQSCVIDSIQCF